MLLLPHLKAKIDLLLYSPLYILNTFIAAGPIWGRRTCARSTDVPRWGRLAA
ncbi:hypothetical protein J6590_079415, partial [Homalodisca vitripennis]